MSANHVELVKQVVRCTFLINCDSGKQNKKQYA